MPFRAIIGHRRLLALTSRAIARGTLPPSLLLAGPAGVGKRRTAVAVAEAINCLQPLAGDDYERDACGACTACRRIARGVHPDVIVLEPGESGTIKIEQVRDVIDKAGFRPFEGRRRVVIIDEADALVVPAQNAMLKTLEEPPSASVFLLVSSIPDALLPTVLSRCPRLRFGTIAATDIADILMRDHEYSEGEARAAAADADGSIGRALSAASSDLADARDLARRLLEQAARTADPVRRLDAARDLSQKSGPTTASEREQMAASLRALASLLRDIGVLATNSDERWVANADLRAELGRLAGVFGVERSSKAYGAVDEALAALARNVSPKVVADWLVLRL